MEGDFDEEELISLSELFLKRALFEFGAMQPTSDSVWLECIELEGLTQLEFQHIMFIYGDRIIEYRMIVE
jgi:hypothetical protein